MLNVYFGGILVGEEKDIAVRYPEVVFQIIFKGLGIIDGIFKFADIWILIYANNNRPNFAIVFFSDAFIT